jgi:hypothetical protein
MERRAVGEGMTDPDMPDRDPELIKALVEDLLDFFARHQCEAGEVMAIATAAMICENANDRAHAEQGADIITRMIKGHVKKRWTKAAK